MSIVKLTQQRRLSYSIWSGDRNYRCISVKLLLYGVEQVFPQDVSKVVRVLERR
ncbi:MAG TPA: hypothetical protein VK636_08930 [Gemmatimonadaceae bacterium]|nr:hypothetical protein [Gemmatimonadaceae bacterium]